MSPSPAAQRVGLPDPREVDRGVAHVRPGQRGRPVIQPDGRRGQVGGGRVDDEEGAPLGAEGRRVRPDRFGQIAGRAGRRDAEDGEQVRLEQGVHAGSEVVGRVGLRDAEHVGEGSVRRPWAGRCRRAPSDPAIARSIGLARPGPSTTVTSG